MRSPSGSNEICNDSGWSGIVTECVSDVEQIASEEQIAPGSCMKTAGMVKSCLEIYSACNGSAPLQLRAKIYSGPAVPMGFLTLPERRRRKKS